MTPQVQSMIAVTYVKDIGASCAFYELLGLRESASGREGASAWSVVRHGEVSVLLAMTELAPDLPPLPMLCYFYYEDIGAVTAVLDQAGVPVTRTGHPPHALGGEVRVLDPDGNTVLLGQRERSPSAAPADDEGDIRFSVLQEAAMLVASRGGTPRACEFTVRGGRRCPDQAEVKLADSLGDSAWFCLLHAEHVLVTVPGAFIASHDDRGITAFLATASR